MDVFIDDSKHLRACGRILRELHNRGLINRQVKKTVYGQLIHALPAERARRLCALGAYHDSRVARAVIERGLMPYEREKR